MLYSSSPHKQHLYLVEKTRDIGQNIFDNIIIKWVYLGNNLNEEEYVWIGKLTMR